MSPFTAHHLRFTVEVQTPLELPPYKGPALRGALFGALRAHYCPAQGDPGPEHSAICPVCWLMAREELEAERGKDVPRLYTLEPPLREWTRLEPGETFSFGITLFAQAVNLFPYLILAVPEMGRIGVGQKLAENGYRRGRFALQRVEAVNLLTGEIQTILAAGENVVQVPELPVTEVEVRGAASYLAGELHQNGGTLSITYLTPTRITHQKHLAKEPTFSPLFHRLLERLEALMTAYSEGSTPFLKGDLLPLADQVRLVDNHVRWMDVQSYSKRQGRATPVGGFVGQAVYQAAEWGPLLEPLVWGQITHVGKNVVKGDGWYRLHTAT